MLIFMFSLQLQDLHLIFWLFFSSSFLVNVIKVSTQAPNGNFWETQSVTVHG